MFFPLLKTAQEKQRRDAVCENRSARVHAAIVQKFLVSASQQSTTRALGARIAGFINQCPVVAS